MTDRDEIIRLAREAEIGDSHGYIIRNQLAHLERFAALIEDAYRQRLLAGVGEPVGEVYRYGKDSHGREWHGVHWYDPNVDTPNGTKLYTADQLAAAVERERDLLGKANALARIRAERIAELESECCNHDCNQGRDCPKRKQ